MQRKGFRNYKRQSITIQFLTMKDKNIAILAYLSSLLLIVHFLLFIAVLGVAVILNNGRNNEFVSFHIRQMLGIASIALILNVFAGAIPEGYGWLALIIILSIVVIAMLGLISAARNQKDELPFIGAAFQKWFSFIK